MVVRSNCNADAYQLELDKYIIDPNHIILKSDFNYNFETKVADVICTCVDKPRIKKILPTTENMNKVICYPQCPRSLFVSTCRQCVRSTKTDTLSIDHIIIQKYHKFCDFIFEDEIQPIIDKHFEYNLQDYMNHLKSLAKQQEVIDYYNDFINNNTLETEDLIQNCTKYTLFSKEEKQILELDPVGNPTFPKCRAISACSPQLKWIMGPVILELERIFGLYLKGYKINQNGKQIKTWEEIENYYEECYASGFINSLDIDGSRWDTTVRGHMRYLPNKIYKYLADTNKIYHVTPNLFHDASTATYRTLTAKSYIGGRSYTIMSVRVKDTTFSGNPDTTWLNTTVNLSVGRYIAEDVCGISKDQYAINTAGDDYNSMSTPHNIENIKTQVPKIWKGLGLCPKYAISGDFTNITFCSTNVIPYEHNNKQKFKIVRLLNRMNPLMHYSISAMHLSRGQLKKYYNELALGIEHWAPDSLPYYSDYAKAFRYHAQQITEPEENMPIGRKKMIFQGTNRQYEMADNDYEKHKDSVRISVKRPPDHYVHDFLLQKYGVSATNIDSLYHDLTTYVAYNNGVEIN